MYRFQSLQRHWELNKSFVETHITTLKSVEGDGSGEFELLFSETVEWDFDYFPEYLRASTLSLSILLVENLLLSLCEDMAEELNTKINLVKDRMPYINKYILWLIHGCGIEIKIDEDVWIKIEAIRKVRNNFVHKIDKDIPEVIKEVISEMVSKIANDEKLITNEFVDEALCSISDLVKAIELAYIKFYETKKSQNAELTD